MQLSRVIFLEENLWAINEIDKTVVYVINGSDKILLIDTGLGLTDYKKVINELCGNKPCIVVNTHAHLDHNSGNEQFESVYVGRYDEPYSHQAVDDNMKKMSIEMFFDIPIKNGYEYAEWNPKPAEKIWTVQEGDVFDLGDTKLKVIEVPSHTLGSIALFEENKGWLFTGDIMLTWPVWGQLNIERTTLAPSVVLKVYYESLLKLKNLGKQVKQVFPAHVSEAEKDRYEKYALSPDIIEVYCANIAKILSGEEKGELYRHSAGDGKVVFFEIGGIVYDEKRMN